MKVERVQQIYGEIERYSITLSSDPASLGPQYLQEQIAACRDHINNVTKLLMEIHREKHNLSAEVHTAETMFRVESDNLLATDKRIRDLPNIKDRESAIALLLRERVRELAELKARLQDLDFIEKAVRHRHHELRDTMAEIKLQRSLIRDELDTKSFYGGERDTPDAPAGDDIGAEDIESLMHAAGSMQAEARARIASPTPKPAVFCSVCGELQVNTPSGLACKNGHGAAPSVNAVEAEAIRELTALEGGSSSSTQVMPEDDDDAAMAAFLAEGDDEGAPKSAIVADDFSDILDNV